VSQLTQSCGFSLVTRLLLLLHRTDPGFALPLIAMVFKSDFSPAWSNLAEALAIIPDAEQVLVLSSIAWYLDPKNP